MHMNFNGPTRVEFGLGVYRMKVEKAPRIDWTPDLEALKEAYARGGLKEAVRCMPHRSYRCVQSKIYFMLDKGEIPRYEKKVKTFDDLMTLDRRIRENRYGPDDGKPIVRITPAVAGEFEIPPIRSVFDLGSTK